MTPPKRVLILLYSQTGQLTEVVEQIIAPMQADPAIKVHVQLLKPVKPFPYPWPFFEFMDAFPESALMRPCPMQALDLADDAEFDLVILPIKFGIWHRPFL